MGQRPIFLFGLRRRTNGGWFDYKRKPDVSMAIGKADERSEVEVLTRPVQSHPPSVFADAKPR